MISLPLVEKKVNSVVLWRGNSQLNNEPIVVIATGLRSLSKNEKTGEFVQTYIFSDTGFRPTEALNHGVDASVCGDCIHRKENGWGTCYVNLGQGGNAVYDAYKRGSYPVFDLSMLDDYFAGRLIRLGSYGDPAAVPIHVWQMVCGVSLGWTGYTHQWRKCDPELKKFCMASVESTLQQKRARKMGWKTFRVRNEDEPLENNEFVCPASVEAKKSRKCEDCLACCGGEWNGKQYTPVIKVHGVGYKVVRFKRMQRQLRNKKKYRTLMSSLIGLGASKGKGSGILTK